MKDLKHLIYFENLLDSANNELVQQAKDEGMHPIAYTCYHMPEVVLNVDNCFSVRLRAPKTGSFDIASYYMSNYTCEYCRALVERAIEGGYNFLDAIAGVDACAEMNRCMENIELVAAPRHAQQEDVRYPLRHSVQSQGLHPQALRHADPQPLP